MLATICNNSEQWDAFVESEKDSVNYHRWTWRHAIETTFGHKPYYLVAGEKDNIQGVLPLYLIDSYLFGRSLVSVPFFTYGGVLARSEHARDALLGKAAEIADDVGAKHVELRQAHEAGFGWYDVSPKVTMEVDLGPTEEDTFGRLSAKLRKRIRFAKKNGLSAEWFGPEALGQFYEIFSVNMRNLGTPVYPRKWFEALFESDPLNIRILVLFDGGQPVASAFVSGYRDTLEMPWAASMLESRKKFSPLLMYWSIIEFAHRNGYSKVDLGRCTRGTGNYEFKTHWATNERPLYWSYWLKAGASVPSLRPENAKFHLAVELWKRMPLALANALGPVIVRSIP